MGFLDTVTTAYDGYQKVQEIAQKIKDADLLLSLADLKMALAEVKVQAANLMEQNAALQQQIQKSTEATELRSKLSFEHNQYYLLEDVSGYGKKKDGPFCQVCFDLHGSLVRMASHHDASGQSFWCNVCPKRNKS